MKPVHPYRLAHSFKYAFEGLSAAIESETNWKIGVVEGIITILAGFYFHIKRDEWFIILILIGLVLAAELFNSAIETIVDSFTSSQHPGAKRAKDISAAAVVTIILAAAVVGFIVFLPYLKQTTIF